MDVESMEGRLYEIYVVKDCRDNLVRENRVKVLEVVLDVMLDKLFEDLKMEEVN